MNIRDQLFKTKFGSMYRFGGSSDSNQSNSSSTSSNTSTNNETNNTTSDWSYSNSTNTTANTTNTLTQDRRLVNDHGVGVSSDGGDVATINSGNSTSNSVADNSWYNNSSSSYSSVSNISMSDFGAISAAKDVQLAAMGANGKLGEMTILAGRELASQSIGMLNANIAYAKDISRQNVQQQENALAQVKSAFDTAMQQVSFIASKPLNANDPQHILVIVGLVVFGVFAFNRMKG